MKLNIKIYLFDYLSCVCSCDSSSIMIFHLIEFFKIHSKVQLLSDLGGNSIYCLLVISFIALV